MRPVLPALALTLLLAPPLQAQEGQQGLRVQRDWKLAVIGLDLQRGFRARPLLRYMERSMRRELPGLRITFDRERFANFKLAGSGNSLSGEELVRAGLRAAERSGIPVSDYDVVFVLTPYGDRYFGSSHISYVDKAGRKARGAFVHSRPYEIIFEGLLRGIPPERRVELEGLLERGKPALRAILDLPGIREFLLAPTIAHEFGHFLAPGDYNVRDGYSKRWLRHGMGPKLNPEGHGIECVMYKGRSMRFYLEKLVAIRGRLVVFCDPCREKLGLLRRRRLKLY